MEFFTSLVQWNRHLKSKGLITVSETICNECKRPVTYRLGLCEECYADLFKNAKETNEVSDKEKL